MKKKKILLVDDETALVELLTRRLQADGFEVITAADGREGLEKAEKERPDLVLLDVMMPNMDGYEVLQSLKEMDETRDIPVIMFTVKSNAEDIERAVLAGAADYITKPFAPQVLMQRIREVM